MNDFEHASDSLKTERPPLPTQDSLGGPDGALEWIVDRLRSKMPADLKESDRLKLLQEVWGRPDPRLDNQSPRRLFDTDPDRVIQFIDTLKLSR